MSNESLLETGRLGVGFLAAAAVGVSFLLARGVGFEHALFGYLYALFVPFPAISHYPLSAVVLSILFLLFRRVRSCMRPGWRWIAYGLLFLHWALWGLYCTAYASRI